MPFAFKLNARQYAVVERLLQGKNFQHICTFQSAAFQTQFPDLFLHYKTTMDVIKAKLPHLCFPVAKSVFPGISVNFGGKVGEPRLILEVPVAATAFIMPAPCTHSDLPLAEGDSRVSLTQYAAGPIFRYVCMAEEELKRVILPRWKC